MTNKIVLDYPHPILVPVMESAAKIKIISAGRRGGKTSYAKYEVAIELLKNGGSVVYVAPTYRMADEIFEFFKESLKSIGTVNVTNRTIRLKNGGIFKIFSADNAGDSLRGLSLDLVVIDEAAMIADLHNLVFMSAMPTLVDRSGKMIIISTPRGRNAFYELWLMGQSKLGQYKDYQSWQFKTLDNPYIDPKEVELARLSIPERIFSQEYLGEFLLDGGEFFRNVKNVSTLRKSIPYSGRIVGGIDFGKTNDYTVFCLMDCDTKEQVEVYRFNKINWETQRQEIKEIYDKWRPFKIIAEQNSIGDVNIELLKKAGLPITPFYTTNKSKKNIVERLSVDIENENIKLLNDHQQLVELQSYTISITASGNYKFGAPVGGFDDMVMALALANEARSRMNYFKGSAIANLWGA